MIIPKQIKKYQCGRPDNSKEQDKLFGEQQQVKYELNQHMLHFFDLETFYYEKTQTEQLKQEKDIEEYQIPKIKQFLELTEKKVYVYHKQPDSKQYQFCEQVIKLLQFEVLNLQGVPDKDYEILKFDSGKKQNLPYVFAFTMFELRKMVSLTNFGFFIDFFCSFVDMKDLKNLNKFLKGEKLNTKQNEEFDRILTEFSKKRYQFFKEMVEGWNKNNTRVHIASSREHVFLEKLFEIQERQNGSDFIVQKQSEEQFHTEEKQRIIKNLSLILGIIEFEFK